MEILFFILVLLIVIIYSITRVRKQSYSKEAILILKTNFNNKNFENINSFESLKKLIEIKNNNYHRIIEKILDETRINIDKLHMYREKNNLPYNELSFLKVTSKCVVNFSIEKKLSLKESIKLLLLVLEAADLDEIIGIDDNKEYILKNFFYLLVGFTKRYKKGITKGTKY